MAASGIYTEARNQFLKGNIAWLNHHFRVLLTTTGYTPSYDADQFLSDIAVGYRISISEKLYDKTVAGGIVGAAFTRCFDVVGPDIGGIVIYKDTEVEATSTLIAFMNGSTLPLAPEGANILIQWQSNLIFKL